MDKKRIVVAISGATGVIYGIKLLEALKKMPDVEIHLVMSQWGRQNIITETEYTMEEVENLADYVYSNNEMGAKISSGSFLVWGTVIIPCSMKSLAAISNGYADTLVARCADVALKEHRNLIVVPRENPLNTIHLENMLKLSKMGVHIMPPVTSFYHKPKTVDDIIDHFIGRIMDMLKLDYDLKTRWNGEL